MSRYARRSDDNQQEIMDELRQAGFSVVSLHRVGDGCPDLLVARNGQTALVEVKSAIGRVLPGQNEFIAGWRGDVIIARSAEDVLMSWRVR